MNRIKRRLPRLTLVLVLVAALGACTKKSTETNEVSTVSTSSSAGNKGSTEKVLAYVDDEAITEAQLNFILQKTLGQLSAVPLDQNIKDKMLDSMVVSRSIAKQQLASMDKKEQVQLENEVQAYREKRLVTAYLERYMRDSTLMQAAMLEYYNDHLEDFGAEVIRQYELVEVDINRSDKADRIKNLQKVSKFKDWQDFARQPYIKQFDIRYLSGAVSNNEASHKTPYQRELAKVVNQLKPGETSSLQIFQDKAHLIKVMKSEKRNAKAFDLVKADIKEKVRPKLMRRAMQKAAAEVKDRVEVRYTDPFRNQQQGEELARR